MNDESDDARLLALALSQPKSRPGRFDFEFGQLEYVDAKSLYGQYRQTFVEGIYDFMASNDEPVIIDCKGSVGLSVIRYKLRHPNARVLTFEADLESSRVLARNLNRLGMSDVRIKCAAAWNTGGVKDIGRQGTGKHPFSHVGHLAVPAERLADYVGQRVDLLKLDIGCAEWVVLEDLIDTGAIKNISHLIAEFHGAPSEMGRLVNCLTDLDRAGFSFTLPLSFCDRELRGPQARTPFPFSRDKELTLFLHAWRSLESRRRAA